MRFLTVNLSLRFTGANIQLFSYPTKTISICFFKEAIIYCTTDISHDVDWALSASSGRESTRVSSTTFPNLQEIGAKR